MTRRFILVYRDRPRLEFLRLFEAGFVAHWADNFRRAEELLESIAHLDAIIIDVADHPERAIEFCDIARRIRPAIPIVFLRSPSRPTLVPWSAALVLDADIAEDALAARIITLLSPPSTPPA